MGAAFVSWALSGCQPSGMSKQCLHPAARRARVVCTPAEYPPSTLAPAGFVLTPCLPPPSDKKQIQLGTKPILLRTFTSGGVGYVFAACDRPTIIYSQNRKLIYSNLNENEVGGRGLGWGAKTIPLNVGKIIQNLKIIN